jgi:transcriptional regulator GlxA family with amidase domain
VLKKIFGDKLYFDQDINAFFLSDDVLNSPITAQVTSKQSTPKLEINHKPDTNSQFVIKANRLILELINAGQCSVNSLADTLGISRRTLQLRLQQNQTSYRQLYDAVRFEMAKHYLLYSSLPQYAIAERLNFSDAPAFSKFIKQQSGLSPRSFKREKSSSQGRQ